MNLTLRQLRAFVAIARSGSFTVAARDMHLTQSALSVMVREMEKELGVALFVRTTRRVELTSTGEEMLPSVQRLLHDLAHTVSRVTDLRDKRRGLVRLAAPQLMACTLVPRLLAHFRERFPDVRIQLVDTLPEQLLASLSASEVELAIGPDRGVDEPSLPEPIAKETLFKDRHGLVCPQDHPLARRESVEWKELSRWPFIPPTRDFLERVLPELEDSVSLPEPAQVVSYMTTAMGLVAAGLGLTVCPTYAEPLVDAHRLRMIPLKRPVFYREVCAYRLARRPLSPAAASFLEAALDFVKSPSFAHHRPSR